MFRKLVSNLPYSPALITEVGFYARRLKSEDATRRVTVLFVALAMVMQCLALFSPPESVNASSEQDIIRGGVSDLSDFLTRYDHNEDDIKDIYTTVGVSRAEIAAAHTGTIRAVDNTYVMSRYGQLSASQHEISMSYQRSSGGTGIRYFSPLAEISGQYQTFKGWVGQSASLGWFAIIQSNGSLATHGLPTSFSPVGANANTATRIVSAENLTQNLPAEKSKVETSDKISYTLQLSNNHVTTVTDDFSTRIGDVLEYANLVDAGGGTLDDTSSTLSWPNVQLAPGESQQRTFVVQVLPELPSTGVGQSNPESFDCKLTVSFGNALSVPVDCPAIKGVEAAFYQMPNIGIGGNLIFMSTLLVIVVFFALRTRQLKKEVRIIRHNFNTGII
ncbi:MAG: exported protein of unknown function [Candidatus Saccharibacteria bacterium]|nr:exported protein of unknown function [Candidatus Saccharibacteria bacterium]